MKSLTIPFVAAVLIFNPLTSRSQSRDKQALPEVTVQQAAPTNVAPSIALQATGLPKQTTLFAGPTVGRNACDSAGNIYTRVFSPTESALLAPVVRISDDATSVSQFSLSSFPEFHQRHFGAPAFAVDSSGRVYYAVRLVPGKHGEKDDLYIVQFNPSGSYVSATKLDFALDPYVFAVLPSGGYFLSGLEAGALSSTMNKQPAARTPVRTYTAIFDVDGKVRADLTSPEDDAQSIVPADYATTMNPAVEEGDAKIGSDGNLYILKGGDKPRIEVWTEGGQKEREFYLMPPVQGAHAIDLFVTQSGLVVRFQGGSSKATANKEKAHSYPISYVRYDPQSGEALQSIDPSAVRGSLGCWNEDQPTFLVPSEGRFSIVRSSLRQTSE